MLSLIVIVSAVAFILIVADRKSSTTRWLILLTLLTAVAAFSVEWECTIIPIAKKTFELEKTTINKMMMVNALLTTVPQYILPYTFIMYGLSFIETIKPKIIIILGCMLTAPVIYSFIFLPFKPNSWRTSAESIIYFRTLSLWCIPYIILGVALIIYSMVKEKKPRVKLQKKLTVFIAIPITTSCIVNHFILRSLGFSSAWKYIIPVTVVMFGFFLLFGVKYGIMGVNFRFDKQRIDNMIRSISSGTEMLNHSLKNEVLKICMSISNIKASVNNPNPDIDDVNYNIEIIENTTAYLKNIISRINSFSKDFPLEDTDNDLLDLLNAACKNCINYFDQKQIQLFVNCKCKVNIKCDKLHIIETFTNILKNATDAMDENGKLHISIYGSPKVLNISISDNGQGIKKHNIQHIFEPYFSTKKTDYNFGLGLPYCYTVMNKHNGNLDIISEEGHGTTVILSFPSFRIINYEQIFSKKE